LFLRGTNGILGGLIFFHDFLKLFWKIKKLNYYLHGDIIIFSISAWEQKLCPNKLKTGDEGATKKN